MNNDYQVETGGKGGVWYSDDSGLITVQRCHALLNELTKYIK